MDAPPSPFRKLRFIIPFLSALLLAAGCQSDGPGQDGGPVQSGLETQAPADSQSESKATDGPSGAETRDTETASVPESPLLNLSPQSIKTFHFTWADGNGATEYRLLEDPDGVSGYALVADITADAPGYEHVVFLPGRINARYILQACNDSGCADSAPVSVSGTLADAVGYFKASNTFTDAFFGYSVTLSSDGKTMAVGSIGEQSNAAGIGGDPSPAGMAWAGAVYVFTLENKTWSQEAYVKPPEPGRGAPRFGYSVALSGDGNTLAVGTFAFGRTGEVAHVYTRSGGVWNYHDSVRALETREGNRFGASVALSADGSTLAVSALGEPNTGSEGEKNGAIYLFGLSGSSWVLQTHLKATDSTAPHFTSVFGLSGDGGTVAVGTSGAVHVFARTGSTWTEQASVQPVDPMPDDGFGSAIALSGEGDTLAVGADRDDRNASGVDGARIGVLSWSGAVHVFRRSGAAWSQEAYIKAFNPMESALFGSAVTLSTDGDMLAVGAPWERTVATGINDDSSLLGPLSGAAYVFVRSGSIWREQAYVKAPHVLGPGAYPSYGTFGASLSLSGDGEVLAVGDAVENSNAIGIGGDMTNTLRPRSGAVFLY